MATTLAVGQVLKVRMIITRANQTAYNVRHLRIDAITGNPPTDVQLAQNMVDIITPPYAACLHSDAGVYGLGLQVIHPINLAPEVVVPAEFGTGTVTGEPLSGQLCGLVSLKTARAGHRFRGRIYMPYPGETDEIAGAQTLGAYRTRCETAVSPLIATVTWIIGGVTVRTVGIIWHRDLKQWDDVVNGGCSAYFATQRRRGPFGKPNPPPAFTN